jgi:hypothetical protein
VKRFLQILFLACIGHFALGQDSSLPAPKWHLNGYIKDLQLLSFDKYFQNPRSVDIIHNRINVKWQPSGELTAALEIRNRLIWGSTAQALTGWTGTGTNENYWLNLSAVWISGERITLLSNVERLWGEYRKPKWNIRAGRQRINWGMATTWNPNDLFNSYNFLDFDYEERAGTDAVRLQYLINAFSNVDVAISRDANKKYIGAVRYFVNKRGYDWQFISGYYQNQFTLGVGWAGSIKDIGFKGEAQGYLKNGDSAGTYTFTLAFDYVFKKAWYVAAAALYNSSGINSKLNDWSKIDFRFSPAQLMPARWSSILSCSKEFTPLFSASMNVVYSPRMNLLILYPTLKYNLVTNLDIDLVWQSFLLETAARMQAVNQQAFLRLKWSF